MSIKKSVKTMDNVSVKGKVIKIEPGAQHEGRTYTQYVFFELAPGKIIDIFDLNMLLHPGWVGKDVSLTLLMFLSKVESITDEIYDISPNPNPDEHRIPTSGGHCFSGRINAIDDNHKELVVDIGVGDVMVDPLMKWPFSIGEFVRVCPSKVDLMDVIDHDRDHKNCGRVA
ncbi:hypothetical protein [uncultured Methanoculleus sp.]|jgi:hypothetical protein|uniref:hypothetical protein n=1 Tax=uncultured Methanoculleus sp. TaxID=183762 RepID=UPI003204FA85